MLTTEKLEECKIDLTQIFMAIHTTDRIHYLRQFDSVFKVLSDLQKSRSTSQNRARTPL